MKNSVLCKYLHDICMILYCSILTQMAPHRKVVVEVATCLTLYKNSYETEKCIPG